MRYSDKPCKINTVAVDRTTILSSSTDGRISLSANIAIIGPYPGSKMPSPPFKYGIIALESDNWPEEVVNAAKQLVLALENHAVNVLFHTGEENQ